MNLLTKVVLLFLLLAMAIYALLHILPSLLATLACFGGYQLYRLLRPPQS